MCLISAELALKRLRGDRAGGPVAPLVPRGRRRASAGAVAVGEGRR